MYRAIETELFCKPGGRNPDHAVIRSFETPRTRTAFVQRALVRGRFSTVELQTSGSKCVGDGFRTTAMKRVRPVRPRAERRGKVYP